ncbi:MAG: transcriptional regulator CecR [Verrucomicrobia bacterium]|nr:transcriptional regulator CecR [Verrucomicrobiota bacterium]
MTNPLSNQPELDAKQRLIEAGLEIFGAYNLEGATTRQLAQRAGVNQAAIPYYFGGKEGLYLAVIRYMLQHKGAQVLPVAERIRRKITGRQLAPEEALALIRTLFSTIVSVLLQDQATTTWARIIVREQMQPTKAFDIVYEQLIRHVHEALSVLLAIVLKRKATDPVVILRAHTLVGQIIIFLSGRETIRRRMNWEKYTATEIKQIQQAIDEQLDLLIPGSESEGRAL